MERSSTSSNKNLDQPIVSVIIPLYNAADSICQSLDSIRATNWSSLEVIVVDDGSSDNSFQVVQQYQQDHPDLIIHLHAHPGNKNRGAAATRNYATTIASGKYLAFLDADDLYCPHRFSTSIPVLEDQPHLSAVFGTFKYQVVDLKPGEHIRDVGTEHIVEDECFPSEHEIDFMTQLLTGKIGLHTSTITIRKSVFETLGGFPDVKYVDDQSLWLRLIATQQISRIDGKHVSIYRVHEESWCSRGRQTPEFLFGPVLSRINAIEWLKQNHSQSPALEKIRKSIPGRLYHRYPMLKDHGSEHRKYMRNLMLKVAWLVPEVTTERRFWSILLKLAR